MRIRRRNTAWLVALGLLVGLALLGAGATVSAPVQLTLLAIFAIAAIASMVEFGTTNMALVDTVRRAPIRNKITPQAKEAESRAKSQGAYLRGGVTMIDVGLIAVQSNEEGMAMRRTLSISKDDDGVRPYISFHVDARDADRNAMVRFEILDQNGQPKFVYEVKKYLREGEVTVMSDNYLTLASNDRVKGAGDWESRVYVDGGLMGVLNFTLTPSISERTNRLTRNQPARLAVEEPDDVIFDIMDEVKQDRTPTLQDLLEKGERPSVASSSNAEENSRRRNTTARRRR